MNVFQLFGHDEFKQQQIARFVVEAALLQCMMAFIMLGCYLFTNIEPLFLLLAPFALFIGYVFLRYVLSGIEFADVFTKEDYDKMCKRNIAISLGLAIMLLVISLLIGKPILDAVAIGILSGLFYFALEMISLKRSFKKNQTL